MKRALSTLLAVLLLAVHITPSPVVTAAAAPLKGAASSSLAQAAPISNTDVLGMIKMGLSADIVVAKIKSSPCSFDTSPAALQQLKAARVPDLVIMAMVQAPANSPASAAANAAAPISAPAAPVAPAVSEVKVPDGTVVEIELKQSVSGEDVTEGDVVGFTVVQPVQINGMTVIERGAPAKGRIVKAKKAGRWGRAGNLGWTLQDVLMADGNRVPLRAANDSKGSGSSGKMAVGMVATAIVFWPAAPLFGLMKGKKAMVPAGQRYEVFVHGDAVVKVAAK